MKKNFVSVIIFVMSVEMYLTQDVTTEGMVKAGLFAELEPFQMEDFDNPPWVENPKICHHPYLKCVNKLKVKKQLCAFENNKNMLINFEHICDIHLRNCIARPNNEANVYGTPSKTDIVYYNGKKHNCHYYFQKAVDPQDAIRLYYKAGYAKDVAVHKTDQ